MKSNQLIFTMILVASIWLIACSNSVVKEEEFPPSMSGIVKVNEKEYKMAAGSFRWERQQGENTQTAQTDAASPNQIAESFNPISVEPNTTIQIEIEDNPQIAVYLWDEDGRGEIIPTTDNQMSVRQNKGLYIYEVYATWPNGELSYTFVVEVK